MKTLSASELDPRGRFSFQTPAWAVAALCVLFFLLSLVLFAGFVYWDEITRDEPVLLRWFLLLLALAFLFASAGNARWQPGSTG